MTCSEFQHAISEKFWMDLADCCKGIRQQICRLQERALLAAPQANLNPAEMKEIVLLNDGLSEMSGSLIMVENNAHARLDRLREHIRRWEAAQQEKDREDKPEPAMA